MFNVLLMCVLVPIVLNCSLSSIFHPTTHMTNKHAVLRLPLLAIMTRMSTSVGAKFRLGGTQNKVMFEIPDICLGWCSPMLVPRQVSNLLFFASLKQYTNKHMQNTYQGPWAHTHIAPAGKRSMQTPCQTHATQDINKHAKTHANACQKNMASTYHA